jgi:uncharacterized protein
MTFIARLLFTLFILSGATACHLLPNGGASAPLVTAPLTIASQGKVHRFTVEVAQTADEQERGLMFRDSIGANRGMIFPLSPPREASFWMKNTLIPLDIIFVRADGSIARIAADTIPYSLDPIKSGEPVAAVLELQGGRAAALGLAEDDIVKWQNPAK